VILAGGESRRMGRDKLSLEVGGVPLIRRVHDAISARCEDVILVGGNTAPLEGVRLVPDERAGRQGPLAGMEAGLAAARNRQVFVAAGDLPFLPPDLVGALLGWLEERGASAVVPRHGDRTHPLCAAYDRGVLPRVRSALDRRIRSVREFLGMLDNVVYVEGGLRRFGDPDLFLMNVNSPEDLVLARRGATS
jgi:molybdopterin-guanine dinucleotide biosynthesis protein A